MAPSPGCAPCHSLPDGVAGSRHASDIILTRQPIKRLPNSCQMGQPAFPAASGPSMSSAPRPPSAATGPVCPKSALTIASPCPSRPFPVPPQRGSVDSGLKGKPKLAAYTFSLGLRDRENWGLTVVPLADRTGHDVIWHHFGEHQKVMEERLSLQRQAQGKKRQEWASQCILRFSDALVVSPEWWDNIGAKRRDAIVKMVSAETGIAIGTREWVSSRVNRANIPILDLRNPKQLNLFRDN